MFYLVFQPALNVYHAFFGKAGEPCEQWIRTDIRYQWSWPSVEYVRKLGFKVTRIRAGVWSVE